MLTSRDDPSSSCRAESTRLLEMSVGERLRKNRAFVNIVEVVRSPENVDES